MIIIEWRWQFMRIRNNLFPYPVLNSKETISSFDNTFFRFDYEEYQDDNYYYLKNIKIDLNDAKILELIAQGKAEVKIIVECSRTIYRSIFAINMDESTIKIPISKLRGPVEISCFIYAKENLTEYYSNNFKKVYGDYKFDIDKYDILAVDDGYNTKIDFDEQKDNKISSIFVVVSSGDPNANTMDFTVKRKNIKITLPNKEYGFYTNMKNDSNYQNIFFAIIAIPALTYALTKAQEEDFDTARNTYDWLESVINAYQRVYERNIKDDWGKLEVDVPQKLLNNAIIQSLNDFYFLMIDRYRKRGEDDE